MDNVRPRCIMFNCFTVRAKAGALGYNIMTSIKEILPEMFTAKNF